MDNRTQDELYELIRSGSPEEAEEAKEVLEKRMERTRTTAMRGAAVAIIMRNLSHGHGAHIAALLK